MDFAVPFVILTFLSATSTYDVDDEFSEDIARPDSDGYMDSIVSLEDSSQSVSENPLQIALSRIYEIKRKQMNFSAIKFVKKITTTIKPLRTRIGTTTKAYLVKTNEVINYGPTPGKFTEHIETKLLSSKKTKSFVHRPKSKKEILKNPKFEHKQQTSVGEIFKLGRQDLNASSLLLRFQWPNNKNGQSYKFYLDNVFVNNFSNAVDSKMLNSRMDWYKKDKGPQLTPVTFVVHNNLSRLFNCNHSENIEKENTTTKRIQDRRAVISHSNVLGLDVETWQSEKLSLKQEIAKKMLLR